MRKLPKKTLRKRDVGFQELDLTSEKTPETREDVEKWLRKE